jgi:hypothetical protein
MEVAKVFMEKLLRVNFNVELFHVLADIEIM